MTPLTDIGLPAKWEAIYADDVCQWAFLPRARLSTQPRVGTRPSFPMAGLPPIAGFAPVIDG
jgi:hypothetical protein